MIVSKVFHLLALYLSLVLRMMWVLYQQSDYDKVYCDGRYTRSYE